MSLMKIKSQGKAVEVIVNSKVENFCLIFVQEFGLCKVPNSPVLTFCAFDPDPSNVSLVPKI
jgi:hypothetical protein